MKKIMLAAAPAILLAGCNMGPETAVEAGEWEMTMQMTDIEVPDMPEEQLNAMKEAMTSQTQNQKQCFTEEQVTETDGGLFAPSDMGENCDFGESKMADGVIKISGTCDAPPPSNGKMTMTIDGTYTRTEMDADMDFAIDGEPMSMKMTGKMMAKHLGECS